MLFPNLTMAKKTALSETWSNLTFLMMFNGGNLIGKIIGGQRRFVNSWTATYVVLCRLFFFYTIPFMDVQASSSDILLNNNIFPYVNQMIFSFSSGLLLSNFINNFRLLLHSHFWSSPDEIQKICRYFEWYLVSNWSHDRHIYSCTALICSKSCSMNNKIILILMNLLKSNLSASTLKGLYDL